MKRVVIIHGWEGYPEEAWFPWLKTKLEGQDYQVSVPAMPEPAYPRIETWVAKLSEVIGTPDEELILVGHSIGCQTILRYLAILPDSVRIKGIVLVAPWVTLTGLTDEEMKMAAPWLEVDLLPGAGKHVSKENFYTVFSDNDQFVPFNENMEYFKNTFDPRIVVEHGMGHLGGSDNIMQLQSVLDSVLSIK